MEGSSQLGTATEQGQVRQSAGRGGTAARMRAAPLPPGQSEGIQRVRGVVGGFWWVEGGEGLCGRGGSGAACVCLVC